MKLGSSFGFWIQVLLAVIRALLPFSVKDGEPDADPGETMVIQLLNRLVKTNEDDDLKGIDGDGNVY